MITESSKYGGNDPTLYCVHSNYTVHLKYALPLGSLEDYTFDCNARNSWFKLQLKLKAEFFIGHTIPNTKGKNSHSAEFTILALTLRVGTHTEYI